MHQQPRRCVTVAALVVLLGVAGHAAAQDAPPAGDTASAPVFKPEEIEQLVAPIALYPDPLLAQVLMASTYPLEVVEAARWQKQNPDLKDQALQDALQQQRWDPSVKSLTAFPPVLTMMNEKLDWTQKLGDAFLAQQNDVMEAVQRLRNKAQAAGNLKSTEQQTVTVEQPPANVTQTVTVEGQPAPPPTIIKIEPASPQVVYVPTYNPTVVYGTWPYPAYPPYYYYPPGYVAATSLLSFGVGMAVGAALWGDCNWGWNGHNDVNVNVNNYNNFNRTNISDNKWNHNVDHRRGVGYRDTATQQKYNRGAANTAQSREAFRGRAEQGRQQIAQGAAKDFKPGAGGGLGQQGGAGGRGQQNLGAGNRPQQKDLGAGGGQQRQASNAARNAPANRPQTQPQRPQERAGGGGSRSAGAFQGMGSGEQARMDAARGRSSRESAASLGGGGGRAGGGGGRGGGGGGRGGGGGGRGGGGRGGRR